MSLVSGRSALIAVVVGTAAAATAFCLVNQPFSGVI